MLVLPQSLPASSRALRGRTARHREQPSLQTITLGRPNSNLSITQGAAFVVWLRYGSVSLVTRTVRVATANHSRC